MSSFTTYQSMVEIVTPDPTGDAGLVLNNNFKALVDAILLRATLASPTFTGTPAAPTADAGTNTTQLATTAFVRTEVANLIAAAPAALDTLDELAAALGDDANFASTVTTSLAGKANTSGTLAQFAATTSAQLAGIISDETGTGLLVFNSAPTLTGNVNIASIVTTAGTSFTLTAGQRTVGGVGGDITIASGNGAAADDPSIAGDLTLSGGDATAGAGSNVGGNFTLRGGNASGGTLSLGGSLILQAGDGGTLDGAVSIKAGDGTVRLSANGTGMQFFGSSPVAKPTVTGSRGGNAALASLLTALANLGLITNSTTA